MSTSMSFRAFRLSSSLLRANARCMRRESLAYLNASSSIHHSKRNFSSTWSRSAALASHPPKQPTILVISPTQEQLEEQEVEIDLISPQDVHVEVTERAAEQLRQISTRERNPDAALRIAVQSGGCHGYQYTMELAKTREPDDYHFSHPQIKPSNIYVDAVSMTLLNGSTIDFATELIGSSFRVLDNPQAQGSGCGCGVSWELKV